MNQFVPWPKTSRLFRDIVVTEKLDGTNSAIHLTKGASIRYPDEIFSASPLKEGQVFVDGYVWHVASQSRKRMIYPGKTADNYGFARWVYDNAEDLVTLLGEGVHFGEWWGKGIQRNYGMPDRRFSLFNTERYANVNARLGDAIIEPVPVLYEGYFDQAEIEEALHWLQKSGSVAAPGFMDPEGICVYHTASRQVSKVTLDNNDSGKWEIAN